MRTPNLARIRDFQESDLALVGRLIQRTIDVCYSGVYPSRAVQFFKEFHSPEEIMKRHRRGKMLVVEEDGRVIATGALVDGDIFGIFVHPEFQHRGYGRSLMHELEKKAMSKGLEESELSVSLPSKGFYESLGYRMLGECSMDVGEGQHLAFWKARKPLTRCES